MTENFAAAADVMQECQADSFDKRIEQLSDAVRTRARIVRQHNSNAFLYHRSELAAWLGEDSHLVDAALEFMEVQGCAGKFGLPDTWWIT